MPGRGSHRARRRPPTQSSQPRGSGGHRPRPATPAWRNQTKRGPIPSKTDPPKTLTGVGPTSAKKPARLQEVANEEPFHYTTARYPLSHRGRAMDTQTAFGTQESNSPIEGDPVVRLARSAFLNPPRGFRSSCKKTQKVGCPKPTPAYSSSGVRHERDRWNQTRDLHSGGKQETRGRITALLVDLAHHILNSRGHKPTDTPGINLEFSAS